MLPGTRPKIPKIKGLQESGYITSDESLRLKRQPRSLTFIGGGYITCELAHFYGSLGTEINIVQIEEVLFQRRIRKFHKSLPRFFPKSTMYIWDIM